MRRRALPSPAFCLALLALFVSLGGTTYAITALPRDSVGTEQIRSRAVTENELSNAAVTSRKLANGAVTDRKLARGGITGSRLAPDSVGGGQINESSLLAVPFAQDAAKAEVAARALVADRVDRVARADTAGTAERAQLADVATETAHAEQADQADQAQRAAIAESLSKVKITSVPVAAGEFGVVVAECAVEPDLQPISGGYFTSDLDGAPIIAASFPIKDLGWAMWLRDSGPGPDAAGFGWVLCAKVQNFDDTEAQ
jgi:hypothetical protein